MNRLQKKIITIAMALANISLTTIVATTATFAWFVNNKVVSASGIEMSISADTGVDLRYEVIKYDDDIKEGISFQGNAENFSLPKYDRYISYNQMYRGREAGTYIYRDAFAFAEQHSHVQKLHRRSAA